jgi:hypothetical protein
MLTSAFYKHAQALVPVFQEFARTVQYEKKGILFSEMLFFVALVRSKPTKPLRIIESGRARAQSTLTLARLFPELPVVSIEYDPNSPDTVIAAERLKDCANVELRFGDSSQILPKIVRAGDVVLIDGPKHFRALRLAMRLLNHNHTHLVFVHDVHRGIPERAFLEKYAPTSTYSDQADFVATYRHLDEICWQVLGNPSGEKEAQSFVEACGDSYGPTFAALEPPVTGTTFPLLAHLALERRALLGRWEASRAKRIK